MTAIVGILNKKAAVMAADSALTVTRGDKTRIYNNTTKIFKLSDKYPAAVMTFSKAEFMGVPLGVLINMYREQEGDKGFKDLQGYVDNFIQFLDKERNLHEITNLQRHITASDETVGGPVDVAVLTRDRGFVWMKHHDWAPSGVDVDFRKKL